MNNTAIINTRTEKETKSNVISIFGCSNDVVSKKKNFNVPQYKGNGTVLPIKDKQDILRAKEYFLDEGNFRYDYQSYRNYCLFVLGINIARRIGDMINLKICDVIENYNSEDFTFTVKDKITIEHEEKTGKKATLYLSEEVKDAIRYYVGYLINKSNKTSFDTTGYLFSTRQSAQMTRNQAWKIMKDMGDELGIEHMGTHSMRKTKGYQYMMDNKGDYYALARLSKAYGHSKQEITLDYCGLDDEEMKDLYLGHVL
jgi:integrase